MDSLLANYASSDEEQEQDQQNHPNIQQSANPSTNTKQEDDEDYLPKPSKSSLFTSLPPPKSQSQFEIHPTFQNPKPNFKQEPQENPKDTIPKSSSSSSLFSKLPQPKSSSSSSLFSSLPPPKSHVADTPEILPNPFASSSSSSEPKPKRVVQFRPPPIIPLKDDHEDEDEDEEEERRKKVKPSVSTSSVKSFLSSMPAPKSSATLGALPSGSGTSRRSMLETNEPATSFGGDGVTGSEVGVSSAVGNYMAQSADGASVNYDNSSWSQRNVNSDGYIAPEYNNSVGSGGVIDYSNWNEQNAQYASYDADYGNYGQYESNWASGSDVSGAPEASGLPEAVLRVPGKRGRNANPEQIIEVKQDELMKNRPREDQVKVTGIAFGPAYQPTSTKGKPSKLHKRKHQIGSLYFEMKQKEMELAERRAKGFLTKAQTQGKYGW